jgi:hypothetical protein
MASISVELSTNNITYKDGDSLMVTFNGAFTSVSSFTSYAETTSPASTDNDYFITNLRWSKDNMTWSPWLLLERNPDGTKTLPPMNFDSGSDIYIQLKYIRVSQPEPPVPTGLAVTNITMDIETANTESDYNAPSPKSCPTQDYYKGIRIDCEGSLFRVYDLMGPAISLNRELALTVSEMFGHEVCYFKVSSDKRSKDFVLKEYSLFNVSDVKNVRVVVPNNEFPDNKIMFTPFDMDFESFEVHIVKEDFERAFGYCVRPEERDYLYFPLENRMYEVESPYLYKDFMRDGVYYKLNLVKYQDSLNITTEPGSTAENLELELTQNFDDLFKEDNELEFDQITKPLQYKTIGTGNYDFVRSEINESLSIKNHDINNYFTIVAKYAYDLSSVDYDALAVKYKTLVNIPETEDRVYTMWFRTNREIFQNTDLVKHVNIDSNGMLYDTILNGIAPGTYDEVTGATAADKGIRINLQYNDTNGDKAYVTKGIEVEINGEDYVFNTNSLEPWPNQAFPNLVVDTTNINNNYRESSRKWFAMVLNVSNQHQSINCNIWEMVFDASKPSYVQQTTQLKLVFSQTLPFTKQAIQPNVYYELVGSPVELTNVRLLNQLINEENQPLMLNRYTVRDNQYAIMIDNALPPLNMGRESVR